MNFEKEMVLLKSELNEIYRNVDMRLYQHSTKAEIIKKIEDITHCILKDISIGNPPTLKTVKNDRSGTKENEKKASSINAKFAGIMLLLSKTHSLLINNQTSTRREIYYENTTIFHSQDQVDRGTRAISSILDVPSWELGILATSKGLVAGPLSISLTDGTVLTCNQTGGTSIPQNMLEIHSCTSKAKWILIIEKDAAFQKLLNNDGLSKLGPVIFITAKGYPDVNTRLFIRKLWEQLQIPMLCLVDADPHGIEIMCCYRFGPQATNPFSNYLSCPVIRWVGIHPSDISPLAVESSQLKNQDVKKINSLLDRPYVQNNLQLKNQIETLLRQKKKAEIEGISQISKNYLTDIYLPNKIMAKEYF